VGGISEFIFVAIFINYLYNNSWYWSFIIFF
jgi:hypothetical protein